MYCVNHEYEEAVHQCSRCGVDICRKCNTADEGKPAICIDCAEELRIKRKRWRIPMLLVLLAGAFVGLGPTGLGLFGSTSEIDPQTFNADECIAILEDVGDVLLDGNVPAAGTRCPLSSEAFVIEEQGNTIKVSEPQPELYGYTAMWVSNEEPDPTLENE